MIDVSETFTCSVCGHTFPVDPGSELMTEAEERFAEDVIGGPVGPMCDGCRADFLAWAETEGRDG